MDGRIVPRTSKAIRTDDRAVLYGWGAFETLRVYAGLPFDLEPHLARMRPTAKMLGIRADLSASRMRRAIARLLRANRVRGDVGLRITLTGGPVGGLPTLFLHARTLEPSPDMLRARGIRLCLAPWRRVTSAPLRGHKTLNYLDHMIARAHARRRRADEAVYADPEGRLLEGTLSSLFVVRSGTILTPPIDRGILPGITRARVVRIIRSLRLPIGERQIALRDLRACDEAFITSSTNEVLPVASFDGRPLRRGLLWQRIWSRYREQVAAACSRAGSASPGHAHRREGLR